MNDRDREEPKRGPVEKEQTPPALERAPIAFELPDEQEDARETNEPWQGNAFWTEALRDLPREDALGKEADELADRLGPFVSIEPEKDDWDDVELDEPEEKIALRVEEPPRREARMTTLSVEELKNVEER